MTFVDTNSEHAYTLTKVWVRLDVTLGPLELIHMRDGRFFVVLPTHNGDARRGIPVPGECLWAVHNAAHPGCHFSCSQQLFRKDAKPLPFLRKGI